MATLTENLELTLGCARLARERKLTQDDHHDCFVPGPRGSPEKAAYMNRFTRPFRAEAEFLEMESALPIGDATPENSLEERAVARHFGDMPLIVLTAGHPQRLPLISDSANTANAENWKHGHDALARRSSRGKSLVVADARHFIQIDQPMAVVDAVRDVVDAARRRGANSRP